MMFVLSKTVISNRPLLIHTNDFYHLKGGDTYQKFLDFRVENVYDIVFFGSSRAYRSYDPAIFLEHGYETWNLGTSAQNLRNTKNVFKNYATNKNCKLAVIDLYPGAFSSEGVESTSDLIQNVNSNKVAINIGYSFKDSRVMNLLTARFMNLTNPPFYDADDYKGRGFSTNNKTMFKSSTSSIPSKDKKGDLIIEEENLIDLIEIIDIAKKNNIEILFVLSPTSKYFGLNTYSDFIEIIQPIIEDSGFKFWDYGKNLPLKTDLHFYDFSHMNYQGVKIFNSRLISDLEKSSYKLILD